jgi:hypothetical protein
VNVPEVDVNRPSHLAQSPQMPNMLGPVGSSTSAMGGGVGQGAAPNMIDQMLPAPAETQPNDSELEALRAALGMG